MKKSENGLNTPTEGMRTVTGECKFCHQYNVFRWSAEFEPTEEERLEEGTLACKCESAQWYSERTYKLNATVERIENMLQAPEENIAKDILTDAAIRIIDDDIYSISINIGNGVKVDMKRGKENTVKIKRQEVETREETV